MKHFQRLLTILSDGQFHSGQDLGAQLGITRSAIWKIFQQLEARGIEFEAYPRSGYRLPQPVELLDKRLIESYLSPVSSQLLNKLEVLDAIDSTNTYLLSAASADQAKSGDACFAEYQSGGRGRRGREWHSPYGANIYLSILWQFKKDSTALSGLSLAIGVAIVRALTAYGIEGLQLKWPNDVLHDGHKLAGTLIELYGESHDHTIAVIGVGLNVSMPRSQAIKTDLPWTDVTTITGNPAARNQIAGLLLSELMQVLNAFEQQGLVAFLPEYRQHDMLRDQQVKLRLPTGDIDGVVVDVGEQGELLLKNKQGELASFMHGEVSVRLA